MDLRSDTAIPWGWLLAILLIPAVLLSSVRVGDPDTGFHLAAGREIAQGSFPITNTFSHTFPGHPWKNLEWGFGLVAYGLHRLGGEVALSLFSALLVSLAFLLSLASFPARRGGLRYLDLVWALPLWGLALSASRFRFQPRPQLFSYAGLGLLLWLWAKRPRFLPLWFFLTAALWSNLHSGVVFGSLVCAAFILSSLLSRERADIMPSVLAGSAFLLGSLCNPFFLGHYQLILFHVDIGRIIAIDELRQPSLNASLSFYFLALLAIAAAVLRARVKDFLPLVLVAGFFLLSLRGVRFIPKFAIVALPGMLAAGKEVFGRWTRWKVVSVAMLMLLVAGLVVRDVSALERFIPAGMGIEENMLPVAAAELVRERDLEGPMYNNFDQGGYLIWALYPRVGVFVDGRVPAYPPEFLVEPSAHMKRDEWGAYLDRWKIQFAVVARMWAKRQNDEGGLFEALGWPLVHLDGTSLVYVRPGSTDDKKTSDLRFSLIGSRIDARQLYSLGRGSPVAMARELGRIDPARLRNQEDFLRFGAAAAGAGDQDSAGRYFRRGAQLFPGDPAIWMNLASVNSLAGRTSEAIGYYRKAARLAKGTDLALLAEKRVRELGGM
jgi:hypothetical protein